MELREAARETGRSGFVPQSCLGFTMSTLYSSLLQACLEPILAYHLLPTPTPVSTSRKFQLSNRGVRSVLPLPVYERLSPSAYIASERHQSTCVGWLSAFLPQVKPENLFITPPTFPRGKIFPQVPFPSLFITPTTQQLAGPALCLAVGSGEGGLWERRVLLQHCRDPLCPFE